MKKLFIFACLAIAVGFTVSCGNKVKEVESQRDSVVYENDRLNEFLDIVAYSMDSINGQEKYLYMSKEGKPLTNKEQIRNNIRQFKYNLEEQQKRIEELEKKLAESKEDKVMVEKLRGIIKSLQTQIEEKNELIAQLQEELEKKDFSIARLQTHVETLSGRVTELATQAEEATASLETAKTEIAEMSVGYVIMGTKKELSAAGVLKGGFLKKKKADMENLDVSKFRKVDTRSAAHISVPGKDVKIMSNQPSSSYTITEEGSSSQLSITNPSQFWNASKYLIIQYK
jgi:peptidoglycan hydrolase CwlO-like protein